MRINVYLFKHKTTPFIDSASIHCTSGLTQDETEVLGGNKIEELHMLYEHKFTSVIIILNHKSFWEKKNVNRKSTPCENK